MSQATSFSWQDIHDLFSVVMCLDESMTIVYASETLSKGLPQTQQGPLLSEVFDSQRPNSLVTFSDGLDSIGTLCLLIAKNGRFAIRGQFIQIDYQGREALCFCGAPWLFWINNQTPEIHLRLDDFSAQDVQLDQLCFMSTETKMVKDLEKLNADLRLAKQQLEETQEVQRRFFAQMSHEIRTPLNGVVSALSLLDQLNVCPEQSRLLHFAQSSAENLMQVINYVLHVSKLEFSESDEQTLFDLPYLIRSAIDVVEAKAREKSLPIRLDLSPQVPQSCIGMPDRLRQALLNLLINAVKFTLEGEIIVRATTVERGRGRCILRLEVIDTGVGIAKDQIGKIFEPFWSATSEDMAQKEQSTGLGLDIARRNVASMGGEIQVRSVPGEGTTFFFELPMTLPLGVATLPAVEAADEQAVPALIGHVLLVDDNETNRILGVMILESLGLEVTSTDGGYAAVEAVREGQFDLVLMDISMPDIDGIEATRQIRKLNPGGRPIVVALTAFVDAKEKAACLEVGMADYLTKPIVKEELARALSTWLACDKGLAADKVDDAGNHASAGCSEIVAIQPLIDKLIDHQVLYELLRQVGRDNVGLVISNVKKEASQRWLELEEAESMADTDTARLHVHSLASIFRSVGLLAFGESLAEIETCLRAGEVPRAGWLQELRQLRDESLFALDETLATA